jgi:perosamine synthetase
MLCLTGEDDYNTARRRRWYDIDRQNRTPSILGEPLWDMKVAGYKFHMNDIAASLGVVHLEELPGILARRAEIAARYREALKAVPGIRLLACPEDRRSANWLFTLHAERRENFARALRDRGVETSVVHRRIDTNTVFGPPKDLPNLARFDADHISIPIHNHLTDEEQDLVIQSVKKGW